SCLTDGGCSKLDVYDWLADMALPSDHTQFDIVEVRFKGARKDFYRNINQIYVEAGELVVVESATGGYDVGHVTLTGELVRLQMKRKGISQAADIKKLVRKAGEADIRKWEQVKSIESETLHRARKIIGDLGLSMKLSDVDYQGDRTKATFYYTADERVDFRELIRKLAEAFRVRIEMRQIGMRQEASRLGGIGSCGRELCCSTWLTNFKSVSTAAARYQNLSLNTLKLAGQCGKLKCCLNYELDAYMDALREFPDNIVNLETQRGTAVLQKTDIFKKLMWFSYSSAENWIPVEVRKVNEIVEKNRRGERPADLSEQAPEPRINKIADYENVVGQDSLTRLDDKDGNRRKKKRTGKSRR
ncbi:MAG TPA: regulatory iron-sulfur-containing complex subunit RicT, partial [Anseongella sp.]|nr:regulatory iron-sulfur-containing complex subunit RicT [Anseongella sp.]